METNAGNNKRIAKNTVFLYIRMLLLMAITLYTSRVVLQTLGVDDFGIYNVVGGVVVLFSFINGAMSAATQRFLNYELGRGNTDELKRVFSMSMTAHISISLLVVLLAETVGLWFLNTQLNIPADRQDAAFWCYQFSILTTCANIIRVPYNACIIAYERMSLYACISIAEAVLRLLIVYLLVVGNADRLVLYSALLFAVSVIIITIFKLICNKAFIISRYRFFWDSILYKKLIGFSAWSLFGSAAVVGVQQGANILMNIFFGVAVNAAAGVGNQVSHAVYNFVSNFQTAFNPPIVKAYASGNRQEFFNLIFRSSKLSYFLMFVISLPVLLNCDFLLKLWLGIVPEHSVEFSRLIIYYLMLEAIAAPFWMATQAIGQIRNYQLIISCILLLTLPIGYAVYKLGMPVESIFVVRIAIYVVAYAARVGYVKYKVDFPVWRYAKDVTARCILVTVLAIPLPLYLSYKLPSWVGFISTSIVAVVMVTAFAFFVGLNAAERKSIASIIKNKFSSKNNGFSRKD